jgi:hypothetical protein
MWIFAGIWQDSKSEREWLLEIVQDKWNTIDYQDSSSSTIAYRVESDNKSVIPCGDVSWTIDKGNFAWSVRESQSRNLKHAIVQSELQNFVLKPNDQGMVVRELKNTANLNGSRRTIASMSFVTLGAPERFKSNPVMTFMDGQLSYVIAHSKLVEVVRRNNRMAFTFSLAIGDLTPDGKTVATSRSKDSDPEKEVLRTFLIRGVNRLVLEVDQVSEKLVAWEVDMEYLREPMTLETIRLANKAGQRLPDGSLIPDSHAEPAGKTVTERCGIRFERDFTQIGTEYLVSEIRCLPSSTGLPLAFPRYRLFDIKYSPGVVDKQVFLTSHYGLTNADDSTNSANTGYNSKVLQILAIAGAILIMMFFLVKIRQKHRRGGIKYFWLLPLFVFLGSPPESFSQVAASDDEERVLMAFIAMDEFRNEAFLRNLDVPTYQIKEVRDAAEEIISEFLKSQSSLDLGRQEIQRKAQDAADGSSTPSTNEKEISQNSRNTKSPQTSFVVERIKKIFLPHQYKLLIQLVRQRMKLKLFNIESFELFERIQDEICPTDSEKKQIEEETRLARQEFQQEMLKMDKQLMQELEKILPPKFWKVQHRVLGLLNHVDRALLANERGVSPEDSRNWGEAESELHEKKCLQQIVFACLRNNDLRNEFGLLDEQIEMMNRINVQAEVPEDLQLDFEKIRSLAKVGDRKGIESIVKEKEMKEVNFRHTLVDKMIDEVLLTSQKELLLSLARFQTCVVKNGGNRFAAIVATCEIMVDNEVSEKIVADIQKIEKGYLEECQHLRMQACERVYRSLPPGAKRLYSSKYGKPYDLKSEKFAVVTEN